MSEKQKRDPARFEIKGGAEAHEAAAIAAAVEQALDDERSTRSQRPRRPRLPAWITVIRQKHPSRPDPD